MTTIEREWLDEKFAEIEQDAQQSAWEAEMSEDTNGFEHEAREYYQPTEDDTSYDREGLADTYDESWREFNGEYDSEF